MIYGATGYTGRLVTSEARKLGLRPVLCGRDRSKVAALADRLGLEYRVAPLTDAERLHEALRGIRVVLHAAGPFAQTAHPMVDACLRCKAHYLDITGEVAVIEALARRHATARDRQIMIMPAVGFDVVPSDCLGAHVSQRLRGARRLALGLTGLRSMTRGSAKTLVQAADMGVVRRAGVLAPVALGSLQRWFDYGAGPRLSLNVSWGDVATGYYTTGIPNIETYYEATPLVRGVLMANRYFGWMLRTSFWQAWLKAQADLLPAGPTAGERREARMVIVAEAEDDRGRRVASRLRTPEAYSFTAMSAAAIAERVVHGDLEVGFQTPARVYGADFVLSFGGVERGDLQ